jgi:DNA-binding MarR family transcriptional regulator
MEGPMDRVRLLVLALQREGTRTLGALLRDDGLTAAQSEILVVVGEHGPLTLKALGELILSESASPSRAVDLLVRRDLLHRVTRPEDRRSVAIELTDQGREMLPKIRTALQKAAAHLRSSLDSDEVATLTELLSRLLTDKISVEAITTRCHQDELTHA